MVARPVILILSALVLGCGPAGAAMAGDDEVVVSAVHPAALPPAAGPAKTGDKTEASPVMTQAQTIAWLAGAPRADHAPTGSAQPGVDNKPRSLVHGEAGVTIGSGGYRSVYASAVMPLGQDGVLGIAVSQTDFGKNGRYGYGYGSGYGPYGYGYGRRLGQRGGTAQSVALSLAIDGDGKNASGTPEGCAPGFRDGDGRYIEPLWVTRINGGGDCTAGNQP